MFGAGDDDGGIRHERIGHHHELGGGRSVVLGDGTLEHQGILDVSGGEQGTILGIVLLVVDRVLEIVPVGLEPSGLIGVHLIDKLDERIGIVLTVLVDEVVVLGEDRGNHVAGRQGQHFGLADVDTRIAGFLDEEVLVHEVLPGSVAGLLLLLLAFGGRAAHDLGDRGELLNLGLEVVIRHGFAIDLTHVIFGRHRTQGGLEGRRIDDERQEGQGDDDRDHYAEFYANIL